MTAVVIPHNPHYEPASYIVLPAGKVRAAAQQALKEVDEDIAASHEAAIVALMQPRKFLWWTFQRTREEAIDAYEARGSGDTIRISDHMMTEISYDRNRSALVGLLKLTRAAAPDAPVYVKDEDIVYINDYLEK